MFLPTHHFYFFFSQGRNAGTPLSNFDINSSLFPQEQSGGRTGGVESNGWSPVMPRRRCGWSWWRLCPEIEEVRGFSTISLPHRALISSQKVTSVLPCYLSILTVRAWWALLLCSCPVPGLVGPGGRRCRRWDRILKMLGFKPFIWVLECLPLVSLIGNYILVKSSTVLIECTP